MVLASRRVNRPIVTVRSYIDAEDRVEFDSRVERSVRDIFGSMIMYKTPARAWPGTQLVEHVGRAYVIEFAKTVQHRMIETQKYLSGWKQSNDPPLPEDVCFYRDGDEWPVLVSVTHDGDAWLFDDTPDAHFVRMPEIALPRDLVPSPPHFINRGPA